MAADIQHLLTTRYSDLTRWRLQLDMVAEMCRELLEPWPNRDSSGVRMTAARKTDNVKGSDDPLHAPPGGTEGGRKRDIPLESGCEGTVPLNRGSIGEPPLRSCSSPELAIDMEGLEEILTKARNVRETLNKLDAKQSKCKQDLVMSITEETSKASLKKSMQKATQVYTKQSGRPKPHSAALHSASGSSLNRAQMSKKTSGSVDLKTKSSSSHQLHSLRKGSEGVRDRAKPKQGRTQGSVLVGGKAVHGRDKGKEKMSTRKPEWCSVVQDSLAHSEEEKDGVEAQVSHLFGTEGEQRPNCKETGPFAKEDPMKGHFRVSENGKNIDMPLKYHRLKKAAERVTAELHAQQSMSPSSYGEAFVTKLSQLDNKDALCTADADRYIQLVLFREECCTVQSQIVQFKSQKVTEQSSSQQKPLPSLDPVSLKLQFVELEKSWEELSRGECMSGTDQRSLVRCSKDELNVQHCQQPRQLFYTNVKEWLEYSVLQHEVAQLEWEIMFIKACLTVIIPELKQSTSDRSHLHTLQSVYHLCGITQPSFVIMPDCNT